MTSSKTITEAKQIKLSVFETFSEGIQIIDRDFRYFYLNEAALKQARKPLEELIGRKMSDAYPGIDKAPFYPTLVKTMQEGSTHFFINEFEHPSGERAYYKLKISPCDEGIIVVTKEIDAGLISDSLENNFRVISADSDGRQSMHQLLDVSKEGMVIIDNHEHILEWNKAMENFLLQLGGPELQVGRSIREYVDQSLSNHFEKAIELGRKGQGHHLISPVIVDRKEYWFEFTSNPIRFKEAEAFGLAIIARDISNTRKAEIALVESEARFRALVEKSMVGVYVFSDGVFDYVNPKLAEIHGYTTSEMIGQPISMILAPETKSQVQSNVEKRISGSKKSLNYESITIRKDGSRVFVEVFGTAIRYQGKDVILGTLLDVTEKKLAKTNMEELNYQLNERVKELTLISRLAALFRSPGPIDELIGKSMEYFPLAWQFPDLCFIRIRLGQKVYISKGFHEGPHKMEQVFDLADGKKGSIEVFYKDHSCLSDTPFLNEEFSLLEVVANMIQSAFADRWKTQELLSSDAKLRAVFENTEVGYMLLGINSEILIYNKSALHYAVEILGIDPQRYGTILEYCQAHDMTMVEDQINKALGGSPVQYQVEYPTETETLWYSISMIPVERDQQIQGVLVTISDVSIEKREELRAKEQMELFKDLSFITNHELRHDYSKVHALLNLFIEESILPDAYLPLAEEGREIFQSLNATITKLGKRISGSSTGILKKEPVADIQQGILSVDDDLMVITLHKMLLGKNYPAEKLKSFLSAKEALKFLKEDDHKNWLILLDLNMPEISGWEFLDLLLEHNLSMPVIIVSSSIDPKDKERAESHPLVEAFIDKPLSKRHLDLIKRYVPIVE